jgi:glycyl-tRNA synthetase beta chain
VDAAARAEAVSKVRGSADFESISIAFKRMKNILRQAYENKRHIAASLDPGALHEEAEKELAAMIPPTVAAVEKLRSSCSFEAALLEVAKLRPAIDRFFDKVMVMVEDDNLRANRLALLQTLVKEFSTIADFSEIVTEGKG